MLIKCPECGHDVSTESKACMYCGYPIQKDVDKKEQQDQNTNNSEGETIKEAIKDEGIEARSVLPFEDEQRNRMKIRLSKKSLIGIIVAFALVSLLFFLFGLPAIKKNSISMPYGLKEEMSENEIKRIMQDNGFEYDYLVSTEGLNVFKSTKMFDRYTYATVVSKLYGTLTLTYYFEDTESNSITYPSSEFKRMMNILNSKYGNAQYDKNGDGFYKWVHPNGRCFVTMMYFSNGTFGIVYTQV